MQNRIFLYCRFVKLLKMTEWFGFLWNVFINIIILKCICQLLMLSVMVFFCLKSLGYICYALITITKVLMINLFRDLPTALQPRKSLYTNHFRTHWSVRKPFPNGHKEETHFFLIHWLHCTAQLLKCSEFLSVGAPPCPFFQTTKKG